MFTKIHGSVNGDDCFLDSAILQKAEELSLSSTGKRFEDLDRHMAYIIWNDAESLVGFLVGSDRQSAS